MKEERMHEVDAYDEGMIRVLAPREAVRERPGMYFGGVGSLGMTWALIGALSDAMEVGGGEVRVDVMGDRHARVDVSSGGMSADAFGSCCASILMGRSRSWWTPPWCAGLCAARHASEMFEVLTHHEGARELILFHDGQPGARRSLGATHREGFSLSAEFDPEIFGEAASLDFAALTRACRDLALYHQGARVRVFDERTGAAATFHTPRGLADVIARALPDAPVFEAEARDEEAGLAVRVALAWGDDTSRSWTLDRAIDASGARVPRGPHVDGVLGGVMESLCVLSRRTEEETPLCWDARGALRGARVAVWVGRAPDRAPYTRDLVWLWRRGQDRELVDPRLYALAARAVAADLPAFLNRRPELRDELLRRVLV
jgi:hypothetical protein